MAHAACVAESPQLRNPHWRSLSCSPSDLADLTPASLVLTANCTLRRPGAMRIGTAIAGRGSGTESFRGGATGARFSSLFQLLPPRAAGSLFRRLPSTAESIRSPAAHATNICTFKMSVSNKGLLNTSFAGRCRGTRRARPSSALVRCAVVPSLCSSSESCGVTRCTPAAASCVEPGGAMRHGRHCSRACEQRQQHERMIRCMRAHMWTSLFHLGSG